MIIERFTFTTIGRIWSVNKFAKIITKLSRKQENKRIHIFDFLTVLDVKGVPQGSIPCLIPVSVFINAIILFVQNIKTSYNYGVDDTV